MSEFDITNLSYYLNQFDYLSPFEFEDMVAQMLYCKGWTDVKLTSRTGDKGRDIIGLDLKGRRVFVEVKQQEKRIGRPVIQKLHSIMVTEKAERGMVVTISDFSSDAIEYARTSNIKLMDGKKFIETCEYLLNNAPRSDSLCMPVNSEKLKEMAYEYFNSYIFTYPQPSSSFIKKAKFLPFLYFPYLLVIASVDQDFQNKSGSFYYHMSYPNVGYIFSEEGQVVNDKFKDIKMKYAIDIKNIQKHLNEKDIPFQKKTIPSINRDKLRKFIQRFRTEKKKYRGQNNQAYTRVCKPTLTNIEIHHIFKYWQLETAIDLKIDKYTQFRVEFENSKTVGIKFLNYPTKKETARPIRMCQKCQALMFKGSLKSKYYKCQGCGMVLCQDCIHENKWCVSCAKKISYGTIPPKKNKEALKLLKKEFKNWGRIKKPLKLKFLKS